MTQNLTPNYQAANNSTSETAVSWTDYAAELVGTKPRFRAAKRPEFVDVPRNALRDVRLCETSATLLGLLIYLGEHGGRVALSRMAGWLLKDRSTVTRAAEKLQRLKIIDEHLRPLPGYDDRLWPRVRAPGFLRVEFRTIDKLGCLKLAIAHEQMQEVPSLRSVEVDPDGSFPCTGKLFAQLIGRSAKTAYKRLAALGARTIQLGKHPGFRSTVRLLAERAWKRPKVDATKAKAKADKPAAAPKPEQPGALEGGVLMSFADQLLERLRHGAGPQPPPPPTSTTP